MLFLGFGRVCRHLRAGCWFSCFVGYMNTAACSKTADTYRCGYLNRWRLYFSIGLPPINPTVDTTTYVHAPPDLLCMLMPVGWLWANGIVNFACVVSITATGSRIKTCSFFIHVAFEDQRLEVSWTKPDALVGGALVALQVLQWCFVHQTSELPFLSRVAQLAV